MTDMSSAGTIRNIHGRTDGTSFFARLARAFDAHARRAGRYDEIRRLNAKSDEELAALGISRDRIPHYVFSDLFHL